MVGSVKVVMSDQSIFNGMISLDTGHGINTEGFHLIGSTLGSNLLAPTGGLPAGSYTDVVIRATQGISTLTIDPTLTAGSLAVTVNGSTSPAPVPSGDSMWIAVRNNPDNNVNTFVAFRPQGTDGSIQRTVFGGAANIDLVIPTTEANQYGQFVGVTPGLYEVILYAYGEGKVLASVLLSISDAVSPPFLLFATPAGAANSNVVFIVEVVGGTVLGGTSAAVVARGTIVLGNTYMSNYSSAQHPQNVTVQFTLSGAPNEIPQTISIGSPIVQSGANPITQTLDTTQYPDGTYIISAKIIDLNDIVHDGGYKWNAYQIVVLPTNLVIANGDPNAPKGLNDFTTPRIIPVAYFFGNVRTQPTGVDYV